MNRIKTLIRIFKFSKPQPGDFAFNPPPTKAWLQIEKWQMN